VDGNGLEQPGTCLGLWIIGGCHAGGRQRQRVWTSKVFRVSWPGGIIIQRSAPTIDRSHGTRIGSNVNERETSRIKEGIAAKSRKNRR